jgi:pimeloyl-ACP methyl ester carboxylesterase
MPIVRAGDADIYYDIQGEGDPLLLIMGFLSDSQMWMLQTPVFAPLYKVITFDNRGVGRSSVPPGPYTMEQMAADALAVMDAAGVDRAHVCGISMGSAIAQHVAIKAPERVRSLTLAATWSRPNEWMTRLSQTGEILAGISNEQFARSTLLWLFTPKFVLQQPELLAAIEQMMLGFETPPDTFVNQIAAVRDHDTRLALTGLTVPALVLGARRDIMVPPELAEETAQAIPGAEFKLLDGAHAFSAENVQEFNGAILEFLAKH